LGCGARDQQAKLIRLTAAHQELRIDPEGTGRGGYLHRDEACWHDFLRRKSLYRAFRVEINRSSKEKLIRELRERNWE
jgi:predicted RNA-binding protein YlxR (DUF448 family)